MLKRPLAANRPGMGTEAGGRLRVFALRRPKPAGYTMVNTTSTANSGLSPFNVGPISLYGGRVAANLENAWQFAKVYLCHTDPVTGDPTEAYWKWAEAGWANSKAQRFPMGRGAKPQYSWWDGRRMGYIEARKVIYAHHCTPRQFLEHLRTTNSIDGTSTARTSDSSTLTAGITSARGTRSPR